MWKFVVLLLLTVFAMLVAQLVSDAPVIQTRVGALVSQMQGGASAPLTPRLMYAGVRG